MSVLRFPLLFVGPAGEKKLDTLFNSGVNLSCIYSDLIDCLAEKQVLGRVRQLWTLSKRHFIEIKYAVRLYFYINDILLSDEFLLVPNLSEEAIIGAATLQKWRIKLDFEHDQVVVDPKVAKLQLI